MPTAGDAPRSTPHEAHAFVPEADDADRCGVCGEPRMQIRHHPTRVEAARLLRGEAAKAAS